MKGWCIRREIIIPLGLLVAALVLYLLGLGNVPLRDWDEGYHATIAKDMYLRGEWLYRTYFGEPNFNKPPLMQWLVIPSYHLWGVSEFSSRFPLAVISAAGVPLLYLIGREVFPRSREALWAALVYLTLLPVVRHGRLAMLDGISVSFFLLTILCLFKARRQKIYALGVGIGLGLIGLTKGILVLLLGAVAFAFLLLEDWGTGNRKRGTVWKQGLAPRIVEGRGMAVIKNFYLWLGLIIGFLPLGAWYFAQWQEYGDRFLSIHFLAQGFGRVNQAVEGNTGPPWYYLLEILKYSWPWLLFFPGGMNLAWQQRKQSWSKLVFVGFWGYFLVVSVMGTKLPWYIFPVYPFFALAVGKKLEQFWQKPHKAKVFTFFFAFLSFAAAGGIIYFLMADPQPVLIAMAIALSLTLGLVAWQIQHNNRRFLPTLIAGTYLTLGLLMLSQSWLWEINEAFLVKPVAALIKEKTEPETPVYISFYHRPSLDFYSDRRVLPIDAGMMQGLLERKGTGNGEQGTEGKVYLLVDQDTLANLQLRNSRKLGEAAGFTLIRLSM